MGVHVCGPEAAGGLLDPRSLRYGVLQRHCTLIWATGWDPICKKTKEKEKKISSLSTDLKNLEKK